MHTTRQITRKTTQRSTRALLLGGALCLSLLAGCVQMSAHGVPEEQGEETAADRLALAALLIRDRHFERAEAVLGQVDPQQEGLDLARLHTLRGLVALARRRLAGHGA